MKTLHIDILCEKASEQLNKAVNFIFENKTALLGYHDLKLHDVSFYTFGEMENDFPLCHNSGVDYFSIYCDCTLEQFKEDIKAECEKDFEQLARYIGRTSKFYLNDFSAYSSTNAERIADLFDLTNHTLNTLCLTDDAQKIAVYEPYINDFNEYEKEIVDELNEIINDFYDDVVKHFKPFIRACEILSDYKEQQVNDFKQFLEYYENEYQAEIDKEKEKARADFCELSKLINKYGINKDDLNILNRTIYTLNQAI